MRGYPIPMIYFSRMVLALVFSRHRSQLSVTPSFPLMDHFHFAVDFLHFKRKNPKAPVRTKISSTADGRG